MIGIGAGPEVAKVIHLELKSCIAESLIGMTV
jgi:hypothetical protein